MVVTTVEKPLSIEITEKTLRILRMLMGTHTNWTNKTLFIATGFGQAVLEDTLNELSGAGLVSFDKTRYFITDKGKKLLLCHQEQSKPAPPFNAIWKNEEWRIDTLEGNGSAKTRKLKKLDKLYIQILEDLSKNGVKYGAKIANNIDKPKENVYCRLRRLERAGLIERVGERKCGRYHNYKITEKGEAKLREVKPDALDPPLHCKLPSIMS